MRNKWLSAALALSFLLGGCYDSKEMDERDFVISLGVDKGESGGFKVSLGIADGGSEKDNATGEKIKELTGDQFPAAINLFTEKESRSITATLKLLCSTTGRLTMKFLWPVFLTLY